MLFKLLIGFLLFSAVLESQTHYLFGCGRTFKNGRKCTRWDCPNQKYCPFSKYYVDSKECK